jgi:predicted GH43/DUF377 family glycosyl hydrolase
MSVQKPLILLGKNGDIIGILPALKHIKDTTGTNPVVLVSSTYSKIFEGVSYVDAIAGDWHWIDGLRDARAYASKNLGGGIILQWWNVEDVDDFKSDKNGMVVTHRGIRFLVNDPHCVASMWRRAGVDFETNRHLQVVFDRRNFQREEVLVAKAKGRSNKPILLVNLQAGAAPFPAVPELFAAIEQLLPAFNVIDLSKVVAEQVFDLLGLYDRAIGLITVDTATLHLAGAGNVPYIALVNDGWSRAYARGQCVLEVPYSQVTKRLEEITRVVQMWSRQPSRTQRFNPENPPSIIHQTTWKCRVMSELPKDADYFNCGLVERPDGQWLVTRRAVAEDGNPFGRNTLMAFRLKNNKVDGPGVKVAILSKVPDEHFEDPRVIYYEGATFVSCVNFVWNRRKWSIPHQIICEVDDNWKTIKRYDVAYGKNGDHPLRNKGWEKNWLWFFHDDKPHLIYMTKPHSVIRFDWSFKVEQEFHTMPSSLNWQFGQMRGGTPPVRIGDEYWSFFHSSLEWADQSSRRYHMGAYAFEAKPPFKITRYTQMPILSGSSEDKWQHPKPVCIFPCGARLDKDNWTVTFGVNDLNCGIIEIPHKELLKQMTSL